MICNVCPRRCGAERSEYEPGGVCASPALPRIARAAPHYGEEPCISGERGSGTVFFPAAICTASSARTMR